MAGPPPIVYTPAGHTDQNVPQYPKWIQFLLIPILVLTIIVLGLVAYAMNIGRSGQKDQTEAGYYVYYIYEYGVDGAASLAFNIFACVWGMIVTVYIFLALGPVARLHFKWLIFALSILSCIFWLTAFAYIASFASNFKKFITDNEDSALFYYAGYSSSYSSGYSSGNIYGSGDDTLNTVLDVIKTIKNVQQIVAAAAGIGALVWILWMVFTSIYSIALFRGTSFNSGMVASAPAPSYEPKPGMPLQPMYPPEQPAYQQPMSPGPQGYAYAQPVAYPPLKPEPVFDPRLQNQVMTPPPQQPVYTNS